MTKKENNVAHGQFLTQQLPQQFVAQQRVASFYETIPNHKRIVAILCCIKNCPNAVSR